MAIFMIVLLFILITTKQNYLLGKEAIMINKSWPWTGSKAAGPENWTYVSSEY